MRSCFQGGAASDGGGEGGNSDGGGGDGGGGDGGGGDGQPISSGHPSRQAPERLVGALFANRTGGKTQSCCFHLVLAHTSQHSGQWIDRAVLWCIALWQTEGSPLTN